MTERFHPMTDKHSNEIKPTRHDAPLAERYSIAVLRCLYDVSQPTVERQTKTAHVSCHETGASIILTVPDPRGEGDKRIVLEAGLPGNRRVAFYPLRFDSFEQLRRSKQAKVLVLAFVDCCRVETENNLQKGIA